MKAGRRRKNHEVRDPEGGLEGRAGLRKAKKALLHRFLPLNSALELVIRQSAARADGDFDPAAFAHQLFAHTS